MRLKLKHLRKHAAVQSPRQLFTKSVRKERHDLLKLSNFEHNSSYGLVWFVHSFFHFYIFVKLCRASRANLTGKHPNVLPGQYLLICMLVVDLVANPMFHLKDYVVWYPVPLWFVRIWSSLRLNSESATTEQDSSFILNTDWLIHSDFNLCTDLVLKTYWITYPEWN